MTSIELILFLAPSVLTVIYASLEYFGMVDKWTGRKHAIDALKRLQSTSGFPVSFIYDDDQDRLQFHAITKRILEKKSEIVFKDDSGKVVKPSVVTTAGSPVAIKGIPEDWPQEQRFVYLSQHPILLGTGVRRGEGGGTGLRACSLGELEKWLSEEKEARKHWVGVFAIGLISMGLIALRLNIAH
jgi:hypothetical protein